MAISFFIAFKTTLSTYEFPFNFFNPPKIIGWKLIIKLQFLEIASSIVSSRVSKVTKIPETSVW